MDRALPLDRMTTAEKLRALEQIWQDLCRSPDDVPSPAWHASVLTDREQRAREGAAEFVDWSDAKRQIRESTE